MAWCRVGATTGGGEGGGVGGAYSVRRTSERWRKHLRSMTDSREVTALPLFVYAIATGAGGSKSSQQNKI